MRLFAVNLFPKLDTPNWIFQDDIMMNKTEKLDRNVDLAQHSSTRNQHFIIIITVCILFVAIKYAQNLNNNN